MTDFQDKIIELRKGYVAKLKVLSIDFKKMADENSISVDEIYSKVHTISGTSGMYGLSELSEASTEFEIYLKSLKSAPENLNPEELKNKFAEYITFLEKILEGD